MKKLSFMKALAEKREEEKYVSVGLDTDFDEISPEVVELLRKHYNLAPYGSQGPVIFAFNKAIINATHDIAACYKINPSFYKASGLQGLWALERTAAHLHDMHPNFPWILDSKDGDVGHASEASARYAFGILRAPAITVNPFVGRADGLDAFLAHGDRCVFVWCRSSNEGARDFQDRERLGLIVALKTHQEWNVLGNCALVVGATYSEDLYRIRQWVQDMTILIPAIGAQNGDLRSCVTAACYRNPGTGEVSLPAIFNSSRGIIFASHGEDFAKVARQKVIDMNGEIEKALGDISA